ncbi:MAG: DUF4153 domain-containing protein, partial [Alphaproteobacteria bacterium]|nr:DUF4153 domain-containing protein [Alphaproteobacteria bacterium]
MDAQQTEPGGQRIFIARLIVGLAQGLALYLLYYAFDQKVWPATDPDFFAPLLLVFLFVPLLVLQALGNMRKRTLIVWAVLATLIAAGFAWYDVWHAWPTDPVMGATAAHVAPSPRVIIFTAVFLFVTHALISCSEADRRIVPRYATLFDLAWKLGVQLAIAACFVGAFWIILYLGVALFEMIKLHFFRDFINHAWFAIPATALATAVATHITDTRGSLVRGVRTLALMLLGWLLPVIALIAFAFLVSLVFTGLQPLWQTRTATALLLVAAAVLVIHINAAYQDGDAEHWPHHVLRVAGTLASVMLIFIVTIAAYALWLRIDQYGWTVDRIDTAAVTLVALCFAIGYFVAALLPGPWLKLIERWNYVTTILGLIVLFALFTPIADPMRLSVQSQMERLMSGKVTAGKFDFSYLRWRGGRFGREALIELGKSKDEAISRRALDILSQTGRYAPSGSGKISEDDIAKAITVHPEGKSLPTSFLRQDWTKSASLDLVRECLAGRPSPYWRCDAVLRDIDGDGVDEVLLVYGPSNGRVQWWNTALFKQTAKGWEQIAKIAPSNCAADRAALLAGKFDAVAPVK